MLLSKPQKSLIRLLREFGAVREGQAQKLLIMEYPSLKWEPVIRQLGKRRPGTQNRRLCEDSGSLSGNQFTECYRRYASSKP